MWILNMKRQKKQQMFGGKRKKQYICREKSTNLDMNKEYIRQRLGGMQKLKRLIDLVIMNQKLTRPRWYVRLLAPLYQERAWSSKIYSSVRMDTPPYRRFKLGKRSVVEPFSCINNAVGDVTIGDHCLVGLHCTVVGPVRMGNYVGLGQGTCVFGLNHVFDDANKYIFKQGITTSQVVIEDDVWVGANVTILPGVTIGRHSVIAAGAVVNRDIPPHSLAAGVPAVVKRRI